MLTKKKLNKKIEKLETSLMAHLGDSNESFSKVKLSFNSLILACKMMADMLEENDNLLTFILQQQEKDPLHHSEKPCTRYH